MTWVIAQIAWRLLVLKTIKEQVRRVVQYSQNIPDPQVDELIDKWFDAKRDFLEVFGGPIWEYPFPVTFHISQDSKERRLENLVQYISDEYGYEKLCRFILNNKESFYQNTVTHSYEYKGKKIPKGAKLIKAFKNFVDGKNALTEIQNRASQLIQEDTVTGTLCFSVHPLDYLSSSENTYNWRSCHALDGEYCAGNLSYMVDKSTVICYLKGANNAKLPMFPDDVPWNSKKWRVLIYVSDYWDLLFAGRQYPFNSDYGMEIVRKELLIRLKKEHWSYCDWTDPVIDEIPDSYNHQYDLNETHIMMRGNLYKMSEVVIDNPGSTHFNDVLRSSIYRPHYTLINNKPWFRHDFSRVHVGGECNCLRCGKAPIKLTESFMCDECTLEYGEMDTDTFTYCDCCGRRIFVDDSWIIDGDEVCDDCVHTECFYCDECEEYHFNTSRIYLEEEDRYICERCAEELV